MQSWFDELPRLLKHFPDFNHLHLVDGVQARSQVLPVGIRADLFAPTTSEEGGAPLIIWNQRWEYDKRPDRFFQLLYRLAEAGISFRLAVAGENFRNVPGEFEEARQRLAGHIVHWGYLPNRSAYVDLVQRADLVISTADHEFFGISILEAICAGSFPLLPDRLSYPELVPGSLHPACLYSTDNDLFHLARLRLEQPRPAPPSLRGHVAARFDWPVAAAAYDEVVDNLTG